MSDKNLKGLVVDDHNIVRQSLSLLLSEHINVDTEGFADGQSLLYRLQFASEKNQSIDFITTDINHPNIGGMELIRTIRGLSDNILYHNGLRIKYIPIIVLSMMGYRKEYERAINKICKNIIFISKNITHDELIKSIVKSIAQYRKSITQEFTSEGYSVQYEDGKYRLCKAFNLEPFIETKYFEGLSSSASKALSRKILVQNITPVANISISLFEELINSPKTSEKELHEFFLLFPEFLIDGNYDVLYSENTLANLENRYRTDIIAQSRGFFDVSDKWMIVELKKHTAKILTDKKYHANFTKAVYNAIRQLKDYQEYFNDPRNIDSIKKRFNGILPNPRLSLIIGKTPSGKPSLYTKMKKQFPEINIVTYDEILKFRKIQVKYMENLGV